MSVIVRIGRKRAILSAGKWSSADRQLEQRLQAGFDAWIEETGGPPMSHADPDYYAAEAMASTLGYELHLSAKPRGRTARTAYLERRQIRLPFG
jgi:hypothetical protein